MLPTCGEHPADLTARMAEQWLGERRWPPRPRGGERVWPPCEHGLCKDWLCECRKSGQGQLETSRNFSPDHTSVVAVGPKRSQSLVRILQLEDLSRIRWTPFGLTARAWQVLWKTQIKHLVTCDTIWSSSRVVTFGSFRR